ncbi:MAG TPA: MEDS domain-containing protein, partial [Polyangiaceae bacterium]|nr:MEDS domain-containing protein [Polyangiaceae bacterium]
MAKVTRLPIRSGKVEPHAPLDVDPLAPRGDTCGSAHLVQFYESDAFLLEVVTRFVGNALRAGDSAVVIGTKAHGDELQRRLSSESFDLPSLRAQGRFICADASASLSRFMIDGMPDRSRFFQFVGSVLERAAASSKSGHVQAFGEMVALLCLDGHTEAAIRLESLWNELAGYRQFSLLCGYPLSLFGSDAQSLPLEQICNAHSEVAPTERYVKLASAGARARSVIRLQQKAEALRMANEQRLQAEQSLQQKQEELADFLENALEGLHELGADGTVRWANRALLTLLGWREDEYVGRHMAFFYADRHEFDEFWRKVLSGQRVYDEPAQLRCRDGTKKHVRIHAMGVWNDGAFERARCFVRDVTEHRQLEQELKARLEQLAEADRRKDEFLAMLGHELRNPLSAIRNAVATASLDASRRARALEIARRQSDQLGRLID